MHPDQQWPIELQHFLRSYGAPSIPVEPLHGLSRNHVWRVVGTDTSFVVKAAPTTKEVCFYQLIAPCLNAQAIDTPQLLWADTHAETAWFVIEDIPHTLPRTRWQADQDVLNVLHRLHRATIDSASLPLFTPAWTDTLTQTAVAPFPIMQRTSIQSKLATIQARSQQLFRSQCWISGDPNPLNWGIRQDGTIVLYDWERFGRGTPALDLAITVPGLGKWALFEHVARQYMYVQASERTDKAMITSLAQAIAYAKVWNVIEFLAMVGSGQIKQAEDVLELVDQLPQWLETVIA